MTTESPKTCKYIFQKGIRAREKCTEKVIGKDFEYCRKHDPNMRPTTTRSTFEFLGTFQI